MRSLTVEVVVSEGCSDDGGPGEQADVVRYHDGIARRSREARSHRRAQIKRRFSRPGVRRATARKAGFRPARTRERIVR